MVEEIVVATLKLHHWIDTSTAPFTQQEILHNAAEQTDSVLVRLIIFIFDKLIIILIVMPESDGC